jgi:hypothetical protein
LVFGLLNIIQNERILPAIKRNIEIVAARFEFNAEIFPSVIEGLSNTINVLFYCINLGPIFADRIRVRVFLLRLCKATLEKLPTDDIIAASISLEFQIVFGALAPGDKSAPEEFKTDLRCVAQFIFQLVRRQEYERFPIGFNDADLWRELGPNAESWRNFANQLLTDPRIESVEDAIPLLKRVKPRPHWTRPFLIYFILLGTIVAGIRTRQGWQLSQKPDQQLKRWQEYCLDWDQWFGFLVTQSNSHAAPWKEDPWFNKEIATPIQNAVLNHLPLDPEQISQRTGSTIATSYPSALTNKDISSKFDKAFLFAKTIREAVNRWPGDKTIAALEVSAERNGWKSIAAEIASTPKQFVAGPGTAAQLLEVFHTIDLADDLLIRWPKLKQRLEHPPAINDPFLKSLSVRAAETLARTNSLSDGENTLEVLDAEASELNEFVFASLPKLDITRFSADPAKSIASGPLTREDIQTWENSVRDYYKLGSESLKALDAAGNRMDELLNEAPSVQGIPDQAGFLKLVDQANRLKQQLALLKREVVIAKQSPEIDSLKSAILQLDSSIGSLLAQGSPHPAHWLSETRSLSINDSPLIDRFFQRQKSFAIDGVTAEHLLTDDRLYVELRERITKSRSFFEAFANGPIATAGVPDTTGVSQPLANSIISFFQSEKAKLIDQLLTTVTDIVIQTESIRSRLQRNRTKPDLKFVRCTMICRKWRPD